MKDKVKNRLRFTSVSTDSRWMMIELIHDHDSFGEAESYFLPAMQVHGDSTMRTELFDHELKIVYFYRIFCQMNEYSINIREDKDAYIRTWELHRNKPYKTS